MWDSENKRVVAVVPLSMVSEYLHERREYFFTISSRCGSADIPCFQQRHMWLSDSGLGILAECQFP